MDSFLKSAEKCWKYNIKLFPFILEYRNDSNFSFYFISFQKYIPWIISILYKTMHVYAEHLGEDV